MAPAREKDDCDGASMMMLRRRLLVVGAGLAVALTGCNGDDPEPQLTADLSETMDEPTEATPTPISTPTPTPTPTPTLAAVPDDLTTVTDDGEVTIAEAQAIIDIQTEIYNAAIIDQLTRPEEVVGGVGASFTDELARIYVGRALSLYAGVWQKAAEAGFVGLDTQEPTGIEESVVTVIQSEEGCVVVEVERDQTGVVPDGAGSAVETYWIRLVQVERLAANPTGWHRANDTNVELPVRICDQEIP